VCPADSIDGNKWRAVRFGALANYKGDALEKTFPDFEKVTGIKVEIDKLPHANLADRLTVSLRTCGRRSCSRAKRLPRWAAAWMATFPETILQERMQLSVDAATPVVSEPGAVETICHLSFGDYSGSDYAAQLFMDLLVHGWDIARATGQDARLDPDLVRACLPIAEQLATQFRSAGVYGENLSVGADADPQTKLLALVGRRA
jgi:uncharacterized protein (TIGR03086 family)